jgi:hypothetical protein
VLASLEDGASVGSNTRPKVCAFLSDWTLNGGTLHFAFGVDDNASVVLEVDVYTMLSAESLSLSDDYSGHHCDSERK